MRPTSSTGKASSGVVWLLVAIVVCVQFRVYECCRVLSVLCRGTDGIVADVVEARILLRGKRQILRSSGGGWFDSVAERDVQQ